MEKLVSSWYKNKTLPESYIFPPETRPGDLIVPTCKTIPVIDLGKAVGQNRTLIVRQILKASQEYGFFQDLTKSCRLSTSSSNYTREKVHHWRDKLGHHCHPLEDYIKLWPEKPIRYREVVASFSIEAKKLGSRILELVAEGLELQSGYFGHKLSESMQLSVNHYPPCPDPSLTLGLSKHCDPDLLTILHQGDINGLQLFNNGEWTGVEPLHNALVVNIGNLLQIISNNKLKSAEHRVVTNSRVARTTAAFFIYPSDDSIIEPAKSLIRGDASLYRAFDGFAPNREPQIAKKHGLIVRTPTLFSNPKPSLRAALAPGVNVGLMIVMSSLCNLTLTEMMGNTYHQKLIGVFGIFTRFTGRQVADAQFYGEKYYLVTMLIVLKVLRLQLAYAWFALGLRREDMERALEEQYGAGVEEVSVNISGIDRPERVNHVNHTLYPGLSFGHTPKSVMVTLCFFRFWLGFGIGGDYPLFATIMSEYANKKTRGAFIAAVFAMQGFGTLSGGLFAIILSSAFNATGIGVPCLFTFLVPESKGKSLEEISVPLNLVVMMENPMVSVIQMFTVHAISRTQPRFFGTSGGTADSLTVDDRKFL
ncbi:hypothetical protein V6N11_037502 [Hibiscus sabdariffa]|uniref:Fe2OG dioxygenase domain-containing protein n=1 Tax=Hibiscus sabdariffa TaxID=183260 RepID=A0ABR2P1Q7_9ROSI